MFGIRFEELLVILLIILVLFGGKKIPELSRSIGQAIKELRRGLSGPLEDKEKTTETSHETTTKEKKAA